MNKKKSRLPLVVKKFLPPNNNTHTGTDWMWKWSSQSWVNTASSILRMAGFTCALGQV